MNQDYLNIPEELRLRQQWIVWRYEDIGAKKPQKVPYSPISGGLANVNNPRDWGSFQQAITFLGISPFDGIGFVFSDADPYTFLDLDNPRTLTSGQPNPNYQSDLDRQLKIYREFDSYAEISPGGEGLHIIIKGKVPVGRRRSFIEIYSSQRYATFTGKVYNNKPIGDYKDKLHQLWEQMGSAGPSTYIYKGDDKELFNDQQVIEQAKNATNGDKFTKLYIGQWQELYPSQSEADLAIIDIIAFYTQNRNQIRRIFRASALGRREKAKRSDYIDWMITKSFDRMLPPIDFDGFKIALDAKLAAQAQLDLPLNKVNGAAPLYTNNEQNQYELAIPKSDHSSREMSIQIPPGLMGELARFIYHAAPRPVPEVALAAAIGLMAGICGRAYNVSGTGLNQYVLLLANTGIGKEAMSAGVDRLMNIIRLQVPTSVNFIGPGEIKSGQALIKHLNKTSACFVSILGEFGLRLERMSSLHANPAESHIKQVLLDLYNKSGHGQMFRGSIYADSDKNIAATEAPAFSILGESVPERFYGVLNEDMISEGLLPRFMIIEYTGPRPALNKNHLNVVPSFQLIEQFTSLVANCEVIMHAKKVINVAATPDAEALLDKFDEYATSQINSTNKDILRQLWNRAHMKALKLSALIAVGVNMADPMITIEYVQWAIHMVQSDIRALSHKFEAGLIGQNTHEIKQNEEIIRILKDYVNFDWNRIVGYMDKKNQLLHKDKVVPYAYISRRLVASSAFRADRMGATVSIKRAIQNLVDSDKLREVGKLEMVNKYGTTQRAFIISNPAILD